VISLVRLLTILILVPFFIGCSVAPVFTDISGTAVDPKLVRCELLGSIKGATMGNSFLSSMGLTTDAKNQVLANAEKMGATHILWGMLGNGYTPYTFGDAYRCSSNAGIPNNMQQIKPTI
jgi:hypothetical protein